MKALGDGLGDPKWGTGDAAHSVTSGMGNVGCGHAGAFRREGEGKFGGFCERCLAKALLRDDTADAEKVRGGEVPSAGSGLGGVSRDFGDYVLEEELGHGGMGVVFRARQRSLDRVVAIKLLLLGRHASQDAVKRFMREAGAAACLRHRGIVAVYEVGEHEGQHYYSMEYVEGRTLAEVLRDGPLVPRRAAVYGHAIAEAMDFAHSQGVLHRDLKPANVLLDRNDQPRLMDFGVAKWLGEDSVLTVTGELLGSPAYLSPEQAGCRHQEVGCRSDVYSLGAMLYESLTGRPPFLAASVAETLERIRNSVAITPRRLNPGVPEDLETIVLKCLEREPGRRYGSGRELAEDLGRFLRGEPTRARPVGPMGRFRRWVRRRPMQALALSLALGTAVVTSVASVRMARAERETSRLNSQLEANLRRVHWRQAEDALAARRAAEALARFSRLLRDRPEDAVLANRLVSLLTRRAFAKPVGPRMTHSGPVHWVELDPEGRRIATASSDGTARLWEAATGRLLRQLKCGGPVVRATFCADGTRVLTTCRSGQVELWDTEDGRQLQAWVQDEAIGPIAVVSGNGGRMAIATGPDILRVIDPVTGGAIGPGITVDERITAMAFSADGNWLAVGGEGGRIEVAQADAWGTGGGRTELGNAVVSLAFSPDGGGLLAGCRDGTVDYLDAPALGRSRLRVKGADVATLLRWSPDGRRAIVGWFGEWPELWDLRVPGKRRVFRALESDIVMDAVWGPQGDRILFGCRSGIAIVFDPETQQPMQEPFEHAGPIVRLAFGPDAAQAVTASHDGTAQSWDLRQVSGRERSLKLGGRVGPQLGRGSLEGDRVLTVTSGEDVWRCDARTGVRLEGTVRHPGSVAAALLSPDGRRLATAGAGVRLWDSETGVLKGTPWPSDQRVSAIAWAPDGKWLMGATHDGHLQRWDGTTGAVEAVERALQVPILGMEVSPDGTRIVLLCGDASVRVVDVASLQDCFGPLQHWGRVWTADFTSDGTRLVTASVDRTVRIWDMKTGKPLMAPMRHQRPVLVARFSPDGRLIASGAEDRTVRIWDATTGRSLTPPLMHTDRVWIVKFSADGQQLLTAEDRGEVRVWDVASGMPLTESWTVDDLILRAWFEPETGGILTVTHSGRLTRFRYSANPAPSPSWLPLLAEGLAGRRLNDRGELESVSGVELDSLARLLGEEKRGEFYREWGHWYFRERDQKVPPPWEK